MADLERELVGIERPGDYRYLIENRLGIWIVLLAFDSTGQFSGFLASVAHAASTMLGPGVARDESIMAGLIHAQLDRLRGRTPLCLVPTACRALVDLMYGWGARNCDLHLIQVRGAWCQPRGVIVPTFMPETG
jgi:hypothetical protein